MLPSTGAATVSGVERMASSNRFTTCKNSFDVLITWVFGLTFLIAGFPHWTNPYYFLGSVYAYQLVGPGVGQVVAMGRTGTLPAAPQHRTPTKNVRTTTSDQRYFVGPQNQLPGETFQKSTDNEVPSMHGIDVGNSTAHGT